MCQVRSGAYVSFLTPRETDDQVYCLPPKEDYHVDITRSIYHYAYARRTQVNGRKKRKNKSRYCKGKERQEMKAKQKNMCDELRILRTNGWLKIITRDRNTVVVDLTLTRIIKFVVTVQAPVTLELRNTPGKNTNNQRWYTHISQLTRFMPPPETYKSEIGSQSTMCQVHTGAYVSLLTPGETDYTACHPRKTTTYLLHVVSINTHTRDRRKPIGEKKQKKKRRQRKERKEKKAKQKRKTKKEGKKKRKKKDQESKKRQDKKRKQGKEKRSKKRKMSC